MANLYEQRNLSLTPAQWSALEAIAVQTNSRSTRGPQAYQHSWRKVIERVADAELLLSERVTAIKVARDKQIKAIDEAIAQNRTQRAPGILPGQQPLFETEAEPA